VNEAVRLFHSGVYDYIELYAVPDSYNEYISLWYRIKIPFIIHAAHFRGGMNLAKREAELNNRRLMSEAQRFADKLNALNIIVHPGIAGEIAETARQLKLITDQRILIENKPYYAIDNDLICNGTTPDEIRMIMSEARVGFCLDIGHAICSANAHRREHYDFLAEFLELRPVLFHLTDGEVEGIKDRHDHFGAGSFDLAKILSFIPETARVTIETDKNSVNNLNDFLADIKYIKRLES
jgi:sugar phosphate isomerase/epimerase